MPGGRQRLGTVVWSHTLQPSVEILLSPFRPPSEISTGRADKRKVGGLSRGEHFGQHHQSLRAQNRLSQPTLCRSRRQGDAGKPRRPTGQKRSEEHTSELQSLMRTSYAVFCLKK